MSTRLSSHPGTVWGVSEVRLANPGDLDTLLSSPSRLLTLTRIAVGVGLLPEPERREHEARIHAQLSGCRCLESGLGMLAGAIGYVAVIALFPELRTANLWTGFVVGFGVALSVGAIGRIAGHLAARRRLQRELRELQRAVASRHPSPM